MKNFNFNFNFNSLNNTFFHSFHMSVVNLFNVIFKRRNDMKIFPDNNKKKYYRRKKNFRCKFSRFLRKRRQRFNKIRNKPFTRKNTPRSINFNDSFDII